MINHYKTIFAKLINQHIDIPIDQILEMIEISPNNIPGDLSFPCFGLAKTLKKSPIILAQDLSFKLTSDSFDKFENINGFLNAHINKEEFTKNFFDDPNITNISDPQSPTNKVFLEYMGANPNKPLHIGHIRNVCIGDSLRRIFIKLGYNIDTSNYGDDSGVNVGYNILGHTTYGYPLQTDLKYDHYCGKIYEEMKKKEEDPGFKKKLSQILSKIKNADPEIYSLHQDYTKKCALAQLKTCWRIGASFDLINRETDILHLDFFDETIKLLKSKGHIKYIENGDAKGCWIIDLSSLPEYQNQEKQYQILIKSDGIATYIAKDIAFAMWKLGYLKKDFFYKIFTQEPNSNTTYTTTSDSQNHIETKFGNYNTAITIVDSRQTIPQNIVKSSLSLLGYLSQDKQYLPLSYGVVYLTPDTLIKLGYELTDEEKSAKKLPFASRKGWTVKVDDMLDILFHKAYTETQNRNPDKDQQILRQTAEDIAISSLRFFLIKGDISKDIVFDIDEALDMEGETGAYVLYSGARISKIINSTTIDNSLSSGEISKLLDNPLEFEIIKKLSTFEDTIKTAQAQLAPHLISKYLFDLSQLINSYYASTNILKSQPNIKTAKINLLIKIQDTLKQAMDLIGMRFLEEM